MPARKLSVDQLTVESFILGLRPNIGGPDIGPGSSGGGCTVLTTCSPDCCQATVVKTGD